MTSDMRDGSVPANRGAICTVRVEYSSGPFHVGPDLVFFTSMG
ncbi:MAG TPA: hypothetical protein VMV45_18410 [Casimicrobiaceae bacterium]|nr:hypothetical protein [Casimicrobiaceae bacterium]